MNSIEAGSTPKNFIYDLIDQDLQSGKHQGRVATRFPPEPNGYLHLGHAKAIFLNFGIAKYYGGTCNLRFDDTNPAKEDQKYITSIINTLKWLGCDWQERLFYASDYFDQLFELALTLIRSGNAYVCELTPEQLREYRGTLTTPGQNSPYRNRSVEENLELFQRMRTGEYTDSTKVLRAKIDMASPNLNLRDPVIYRIKREVHPQTGNNWPIYPTYDYAHCVSDALENITHSICTLEFEDHRALYDWLLDQLPSLPHPQQIEFARLNLTYTIMSKRKLAELVENQLVNGWDDPRMPTLEGARRRGFTPSALRNFCEKIGVTKQESYIEMSYLEECLREELNIQAPRAMVVLKPLKIILINFASDQVEYLDVPNHPSDATLGVRKVPFTRELYIEQEDFLEHPPKGFYRLSVGTEVRLRYAYIIRCEQIIRNHQGEIESLHCSYDPQTRSGHSTDGRKVKGTIHWISATAGVKAEVRLYSNLFTVPHPAHEKELDFKSYLNPNSLTILSDCVAEPWLAKAEIESKFQFERLGYFCVDQDTDEQYPVFNRTVTLKDSWSKLAEKL